VGDAVVADDHRDEIAQRLRHAEFCIDLVEDGDLLGFRDGGILKYFAQLAAGIPGGKKIAELTIDRRGVELCLEQDIGEGTGVMGYEGRHASFFLPARRHFEWSR